MGVLKNQLDERQMIAAAQRDPARFAELYQANFSRVYAYIVRRVGDRHDAEDLTSEVFHGALRNLARFEWRGLPFAAWLVGIAANLLADRWRRAANQPTVVDDDLTAAEDDDDMGRHDSGIRNPGIEDCTTLYELVDRLPEDQRLVIVRRFVEQKSVREIAAELGRSEGAVKQLQFRALQTLRTSIGSRHAEPVRS